MNPQSESFLKCLELTVPKEWLDRNGHMNMQYYYGLADRAMDALAAGALGPGIALPLIRPTASRIQYKKELFAGQSVEVFARPLALNGTEVELQFQIMTTGAAPALSCECSVTGQFRDATGAPIEPTAEVARALASRLAAPVSPPATPPSFVLPFREDHWFTAAHGEVPKSVMNDRGEIGLQGHTHLFERGGMGMFAELNRAESVFVPGKIGGFAIGNEIQYFHGMREGESYRVRSRVTAIGRKTCSFRHELFSLSDGEKLAACSDHTMCFIDMTQRRSTAVPEKFKEILSRRYGVEIP